MAGEEVDAWREGLEVDGVGVGLVEVGGVEDTSLGGGDGEVTGEGFVEADGECALFVVDSEVVLYGAGGGRVVGLLGVGHAEVGPGEADDGKFERMRTYSMFCFSGVIKAV